MDQSLLKNESTREPMPPLTLDTGYDLYMMRLDLVRGTHTESRPVTLSNGKTSTMTTQTIIAGNPYSNIVADFGNGMILDYNRNLCIDFVRLYELMNAQDFTIEYEFEGYKLQCVKNKDTYSRKSETTFGSNEIAGDITPSEITIKHLGLFETKSKITKSNDTITFSDGELIGGTATVKKTSPTSVSFSGFWNGSSFTLTNGEKIQLNNGALVIEHHGNRIEFIYSGFFGIQKKYTMIKTTNSTYFYDEDFKGCEIRKDGPNFVYLYNGEKQATVKLVKVVYGESTKDEK
jgi:hypothetical protein